MNTKDKHTTMIQMCSDSFQIASNNKII